MSTEYKNFNNEVRNRLISEFERGNESDFIEFVQTNMPESQIVIEHEKHGDISIFHTLDDFREFYCEMKSQYNHILVDYHVLIVTRDNYIDLKGSELL